MLILLTPVSGVVSGGRLTSFAVKSGLIPVSQWMYVPGLPTCGAGVFTEITFQGGCSRSFRVISSGETAGLTPLIASRVTENGYAAQMVVGDYSLRCIRDEDAASYALSYKNATLDFRGSSIENLHPAGEYSGNCILVAATENTSSLGVSLPFGELLAIGPAYSRDRRGGHFWLLAEAVCGPVTVVSAPAIDEQNSYQRLYGTLEHGNAGIICGWDGISHFAQFSVQREGFLAAISLPVTGVMVGYSPSDNLVLLASHCEEGWFQGEVQSELFGISIGAEFLRSPGSLLHWGFSAGIAVGSNGIDHFSSSYSPWFSPIAVISSRD